MKKVVMPLVMVAVLALVPYIGVQYAGLSYLFGVIIPYTAFTVLVAGFLWRMADWLRSPVPFCIPTTCGQEKSLDWIKYDRLGSPAHFWEAAARVLSEVFLFRSLFRNTKAELHKDGKLAYGSLKCLWLIGLFFHWSLLVIVLRHARFFFVTVPGFADSLAYVDGFFDITLPSFYTSNLVVLGSIGFLVYRRLKDPKMRILSLQTDYFPLFLIASIVVVGILMRYVTRLDVMPVKDQMMRLVNFSLDAPGEIGTLFYVHLFLVSVLAIYFPFSKLMHAGAIFLSPTRNLCNNSRAKRHVNPWNTAIKFRTYAEYEDDYREKMKKANLPIEKQ